MPRVKLTARGVEGLSTDRPQADFYDTVTPGLILRVSGATGRKVWAVRYQANGSKRRLKLGRYPAMTLAQARDAARDAIREADAGEDPAQEKEERRSGARTFDALAEEVLEARGTRTREATRRERERILHRELLPAWGGRDAASITRREVVQLVEKIALRGSPVLANRVLAVIRLIFNDGIRRGFPGIDANPAHLVERPGEEDGRDRYLKRDEIGPVWDAIGGERDPGTVGAYRLALLTAQRIGSVSAMRWDKIEGDVWTIPAENFKGGRVHLVPLSAEALDVLATLRELASDDVWVFPSRAGAKRPHVTNLSSALTRIRKRTKLPHWVAHDFRTTFRTWAVRAPADGGLGIAPEIADAVLGHKEASLGFARYTGDQARYRLHEKREALQAWGAFVARARGTS